MNYINDEITPINDNKKKPLWEDIRKFSKGKYFIVAVLLILAILGAIIPVIPGIAFLILAIAFMKKGWMSRIRARFRLWKIKD
ncbi:MAG: hypothetical protein P8X42_19115 [Calditrichaceae bacterium]|jgi:type III secretory pathway component EscV